MNKIYEKQRIAELEQALAEARQAREQLRLAVTDDLALIDSLRGLLREAGEAILASNRRVKDAGLRERITAALREGG